LRILEQDLENHSFIYYAKDDFIPQRIQAMTEVGTIEQADSEQPASGFGGSDASPLLRAAGKEQERN
jgi:hypothetical protein